MPNLEFGCLPTAIGSMPQTDPDEACTAVMRYLTAIPAWPQLPKRSFLENMYAQFSEGFPGIVILNEEERKGMHIDAGLFQGKQLQALLTAKHGDTDAWGISPAYAAGLHTFLGLDNPPVRAHKGQITGPVSWALAVKNSDGNPVIENDAMTDAMAKLLSLKAAWMEKKLSELADNTIIFLNEPYIASYGTEALSVPKDRITKLIEKVLGGLRNITGIHCCGDTDWSMILETGPDIISFDAYNFTESLTRYHEKVIDFITRGGAIAWGIVSNEDEKLEGETAASLKDRLEEAMAPFTRNEGLRFRMIVEQSLLTPSCSMASMSVDGAERALELLVELSGKMRSSYL